MDHCKNVKFFFIIIKMRDHNICYQRNNKEILQEKNQIVTINKMRRKVIKIL